MPWVPFALPFLGHLLQLGCRPYETMCRWHATYGAVYRVRLGSQTVVVLNGTAAVREALVDQSETFAGRPQLHMMHATLKGKGLISSPYNHAFSEHKKFIVNSLNELSKRRCSLESECLATIGETLDYYRARIDHKTLAYVNKQMKNSLSQIVSQNVLVMTFGEKISDRAHFARLLDLVSANFRSVGVSSFFNFLPATRIFKRYVLANVHRCADHLNNMIVTKISDFHAAPTFDDPTNPLNTSSHRQVDVPNATDTVNINIVEGYLKELMNNNSFFVDESSAPVDQLQGATNSPAFNTESTRFIQKRLSSISLADSQLAAAAYRRQRSRYNSFSFDHLSSLVQDLFLAGTETLSVTLNWAIVYAAKYAACQERVSDEIERVLGKQRLPSQSDRVRLPYTEAFINETMRFHCAGPILLPRETTRHTRFRGYSLPAGTFVMVNMWSCMRDPLYWREPDAFDPTRFLDANGHFVNNNPAMMPFSAGKRACVGESIARIQLFLIFTSLLQKFAFSFANAQDAGDDELMRGKPGIGLNPPNVSIKLTMR